MNNNPNKSPPAFLVFFACLPFPRPKEEFLPFAQKSASPLFLFIKIENSEEEDPPRSFLLISFARR
jgi:hypothetical protein